MNRRSLLLGLSAAFAMPAIVRADSLMKIAVLRDSVSRHMTWAAASREDLADIIWMIKPQDTPMLRYFARG